VDTVQAGARAGSRSLETAARKRRLLTAAAALAAEGGYDAVQMRDVAAHADVALGTLYRHFPSKDHLLVSALADQASSLHSRLSRKPPHGTSAADRVAEVLRRASQAHERDPQVTAAMVRALGSADPDAAVARREVDETLRAIIADAIDGETIGSLDDIVRVLGYVWWAVLTTWVGDASDIDMGEELARAARLLLDAR
jgi:AcrR family transcriptional regulator